MADQELYSGLIRLHVLYHAACEPIFGLGMMRELQRHGYRIGPGTFYPMLHRMEEKGYLRSKEQLAAGKIRRCYTATAAGRRALADAKKRVLELFEEIFAEETAAARMAHPPELRTKRPHKRDAGRDGNVVHF
jgi:DNA-binding PadR family transcriptional regulator